MLGSLQSSSPVASTCFQCPGNWLKIEFVCVCVCVSEIIHTNTLAAPITTSCDRAGLVFWEIEYLLETERKLRQDCLDIISPHALQHS